MSRFGVHSARLHTARLTQQESTVPSSQLAIVAHTGSFAVCGASSARTKPNVREASPAVAARVVAPGIGGCEVTRELARTHCDVLPGPIVAGGGRCNFATLAGDPGTRLAALTCVRSAVEKQPTGRAETEIVLQAVALTKIYRMGEVDVCALQGVDLALHRGELIVLLGASGSGKSTLLNLLGGLDVPTSGTLIWRDHDLTKADERALTGYRRDHVGFVFQFYNLIPSLTARENVALVAEIAPSPMPPEEALRLVGLGARLDHFPSQLSGGEQQRVALARAVCKRPEMLLCDEPTGALDATTGRLVLEVIARLNRELDCTTAVITHNAPIARMADRVITLSDGRILSETRNAVRANPSELSW